MMWSGYVMLLKVWLLFELWFAVWHVREARRLEAPAIPVGRSACRVLLVCR